MKTTTKNKPIVLAILDGWGLSEQADHNPIQQTDTPFMDRILASYPHTQLHASGHAVGLPDGQMGNSEVGHLHIGAGRRIPQILTRINESITRGDFFQNDVLLTAIHEAQSRASAVHVIGLLSPGGVHSHVNHIQAMIELLVRQNVPRHYFHAILDGRDTPPQSALTSIEKIDSLYATIAEQQTQADPKSAYVSPCGIASIVGRYYAMDRDQRWERTQLAYDLLTHCKASYHATRAAQGLQLAYQRGETDEFVAPTSIHLPGRAPAIIRDNDLVIFMNFRADRARQLTRAFIDPDFSGFARTHKPQLAGFVSLTEYAADLPTEVAFPPQQISNTLGEYLSAQNQRQLRLAETEKYAHVTYFLNGGVEQAFPGEKRLLVPSPKVATYDLAPRMHAYELTQHLIDGIHSGEYDVIICNYANPDMVGHTGVEKAACMAVQCIDHCLNDVWQSLEKIGGELLITADHGNIECMYDTEKNQPHTAHTDNPVPFIYLGRKAKFIQRGALYDVAPTLLHIMGLHQPSEMNGENLLQFL